MMYNRMLSKARAPGVCARLPVHGLFHGRSGPLLVLALLLLVVAGCASKPPLSALRADTNRITPDGSGLNDTVNIDYTIGQRAEVSAEIVGPDGVRHVLRTPHLRAPDDYRLAFKGAIALPDSDERRVLPDGDYTIVIRAKSLGGDVIEQQVPVQIANADTTPVEIRDFVVDREQISPNGDGTDDEVHFSYGLSKASTTQVYVTDVDNNRFLIEEPKEKEATLQGHIWDGKANGKVVPDGDYTLHIEAWDEAGNFTTVTRPLRVANGGVPRLEIVEAKFTPNAISHGNDVQVRITVRNTGTVPIKTMGPPSGTHYTTEMSYATFRDPNDPNRALYFERPGVWRVGVMWTNAPQNYPIRWGLFEDLDRELLPGEEATVTGTITVLEKPDGRELTFWASIVQEGVGFPGGQVGHQRITVGF